MKRILVLTVLALLLYAGAAMAAVNLNTASKAGLMELTGIGQVKAEAIIDYRDAHDGFQNISDLTNVKGIGQATLNGLKDEVTVDGDSE